MATFFGTIGILSLLILFLFRFEKNKQKFKLIENFVKPPVNYSPIVLSKQTEKKILQKRQHVPFYAQLRIKRDNKGKIKKF